MSRPMPTDRTRGKTLKIRTDYVFPPIPLRQFDWAAWDDNLGADCSPIGRGASEAEAIADLMEQMNA